MFIKHFILALNRGLKIIIEMDTVSKISEEERKGGRSAKSKRYFELNREKVNQRRRKRYAGKKVSRKNI
jgi:hypothetical protein